MTTKLATNTLLGPEATLGLVPGVVPPPWWWGVVFENWIVVASAGKRIAG